MREGLSSTFWLVGNRAGVRALFKPQGIEVRQRELPAGCSGFTRGPYTQGGQEAFLATVRAVCSATSVQAQSSVTQSQEGDEIHPSSSWGKALARKCCFFRLCEKKK